MARFDGKGPMRKCLPAVVASKVGLSTHAQVKRGIPAMRYFLLCIGSQLICDHEGAEFPVFTAAVAGAAQSTRDLISEELRARGHCVTEINH
jgi:hypothetical protein